MLPELRKHCRTEMRWLCGQLPSVSGLDEYDCMLQRGHQSEEITECAERHEEGIATSTGEALEAQNPLAGPLRLIKCGWRNGHELLTSSSGTSERRGLGGGWHRRKVRYPEVLVVCRITHRLHFGMQEGLSAGGGQGIGTAFQVTFSSPHRCSMSHGSG